MAETAVTLKDRKPTGRAKTELMFVTWMPQNRTRRSFKTRIADGPSPWEMRTVPISTY
jgi:hypothetical protein